MPVARKRSWKLRMKRRSSSPLGLLETPASGEERNACSGPTCSALITPAAAAASNAPRSAIELLHGQIAVRIYANLRRDLHGFARNRLRIVDVIVECACGCEGEIAARAHRNHLMLRLQNIARAGQQQGFLLVRNDEHGIEAAKGAIGAPVFGQLDTGACKLFRETLKLLFEPFKQRKGVRRCAGKADDDLTVRQSADLARVAFENGGPGGDLPVPGDHDFAVFAHAHDGGAVPPWLIIHVPDVAEP